MATVALDRPSSRLAVGTTTDATLLRGFLERDRLFSAYALADLDENDPGRSRWGIASEGTEVVALVLEYGGPSPQPLFVLGRDDGIDAVLRDVIKPRIAYVAAQAENVAAVERRYRLELGPPMVRMWVDRERFQPVDDPGVERLVPSDAADLNRLYRLGFGSWLGPQAIAEGIYYGIRVRGRLVAAAGTHVIGRASRIAVVGNVLTQPEYRGRGYAKATTGAVTARLLEFCDHVVLNVRSDNPPAINAYRRLGYAEHVRFEERLGHRIGSLWADLSAALRRLGRPRQP
ncbi:MAG TPA: GNAT family N-acetyltransferase [Candidatus Deferrimicrobiaceae bacterium]|nr:GNAT family N-acetyltransferase [Candidatus Deferrimicrobiaceae bacterium]